MKRTLRPLALPALALLAVSCSLAMNAFSAPPTPLPAPPAPAIPFAPGGGPGPQTLPLPVFNGGTLNAPVNMGPGGKGYAPASDAREGLFGNKKGWRVKLGPQPLATPAIADGKVFIGGGFGSYEFYCFDAKSGKKEWMYKTGDDGPTAAVVSDGYVAFNTESCELEIITQSGKPVWKKWLGDPLMSMPAISNGKIYMAYPDTKGDRNHYIACYDLKTGKDHWKKQIPGEIVTAPVIVNDNVYLTSLEGTISCFNKDSGQLVYSEKRNATSSPMVWNGKLFYSQRDTQLVKNQAGKDVKQQMEKLVAQPSTPAPAGAPAHQPTYLKGTGQTADYLDIQKRMDTSTYYKLNANFDAAVGFAGKPADAKIHQAQSNLGLGNVAEVWAFQGSRPFVYKNRLYSTMGDTIKCVDLVTQAVVWTKKITHKHPNGLVVDSVVTPPAIANGKLFVGTFDGDLVCMNATDGKVLWTLPLGEKIVFQPAVAHGHVYVSTFTGFLYGIETGDRNDDGWLMWGGNPQHTGLAQ